MKTANILAIAFLALVHAKSDPFYNDETMAVEVSPRAVDLANMDKERNPVYLDAMRNHLLPNKILTTFKSPNFIGSPPPGITTFMATQVFLSSERKNGFVYPLFLKQAIVDFNGKNDKIVIEDVCTKTKDGKGCPVGYKKVTVKKSTNCSDCDKPIKSETTTTETVVEEKGPETKSVETKTVSS